MSRLNIFSIFSRLKTTPTKPRANLARGLGGGEEKSTFPPAVVLVVVTHVQFCLGSFSRYVKRTKEKNTTPNERAKKKSRSNLQNKSGNKNIGVFTIPCSPSEIFFVSLPNH